MIPAYNKNRCAAFPFETGIHFRRKTDFFPEEDTTKSYSGFEPEPTRLQAEGHSRKYTFKQIYICQVSDADCCSVGTGGSNPGEDMDVCKCIVPSRPGGTLNSH
ncbi:poly polymerase [Trichonephila clavipes]|nr:poly polymerase [Trichonephila clavipes]